ncbi:sigma-70 family RNA polymerase sigma factor [Motiliproteus sediminis]|uniref:sigma-70 family RNA polymerase sigma factor n=1 Tax=Motiliproteus sediminis TaxID=1468178 RepID=UPI001AEF71D0|nr:sigma-70 family RNA polymerase sigma factor [Motiliproteus sediminis]
MDTASERVAEEIAWIHRIGQGDRVALGQLYRRYAPRIFRFVTRMIKDEAKAEELVNDVMMEIWKGAVQYERRSSPSTWILGMARFRTLNAIRGKQLDTVEYSQAPEAEDEAGDASSGCTQDELRQLLRNTVARLSAEHREVVELAFFHDCSYKEVAEILQCPENTVKTRMYHAKAKLKPWLTNLGLSLSETGGVT